MSKYLREYSTPKADAFLQRTGVAIMCLYLASMFPATKVFGSLPAQKISLLLLLVHGAVTIAYTTKTGITISPHMKWYGLFAVFSFISLTVSDGEITSQDFYSVVICFTLTFIQSFYIKDIKTFKCICWCYSVVCLINAIVMMVNNELVLQAGERLGERLGVNSNELATYFMYGLIYGIWLLFYETNKNRKIVLSIILILISYPLILTGGRKFFIVPIIFLIIALVINSGGRGENTRIKIICIMCMMLIVVWYLIMNVPALYDSLGNRMEGLLNSYTGKGEIEESALQRSQLRQLAIEGWLKSPIWGHGFDTFKYYSRSNGQPFFYSHCNITELLYNGGLIYFCIYYWFFGMVLWKCYTEKALTLKQKALCIAGIVVQLFFDYGGVSYNLYNSQLFLLMVYCAMNELSENESTTPYLPHSLIRSEQY